MNRLAKISGIVLAVTLSAAPAGKGTKSQKKLSEILKVRAKKIAEEQLAEFGNAYTAKTDLPRRLVYISALDEKHLDRTRELLERFIDAQRNTLLSEPAPWIITVILPTVEDYKPLAPREEVAGFYRPADHTLISIDHGRVLLHEFTHALHHADAASVEQRHPVWICEGLASLFEAAEIDDDTLHPRTDLRLVTLQRAIRTENLIDLDVFVEIEADEFSRRAQICYAQARYLMLYLLEKDKLRRWYGLYKDGYDKDKTCRKALEKALGSDIEKIQEDWVDWARELKLPLGESRTTQARLGAMVKNHSKGVKVVGLIKSSPAEQAGRLKIGDVITSLNNHETSNLGEYLGAIQSAAANQTITIEIIRNGRKKTIRQPLGQGGR